jgi:hypothetical protein
VSQQGEGTYKVSEMVVGTGTEKGADYGKTLVFSSSYINPYHLTCALNSNPLSISIQLQMQQPCKQHQQPLASTSKTAIATTTSKTTSVDTKPTSKDLPKPKAAEKAKAKVKLGRRMQRRRSYLRARRW